MTLDDAKIIAAARNEAIMVAWTGMGYIEIPRSRWAHGHGGALIGTSDQLETVLNDYPPDAYGARFGIVYTI